uniref:Uncharacterized protein n=1 Tax=Rousettus aegyptiacus TaxID=9407 RepID=A0A7J8DIE4_ROUAE|nr:hypothetical protein HJG63_008668 [Rousettus aegyptiacus]
MYRLQGQEHSWTTAEIGNQGTRSHRECRNQVALSDLSWNQSLSPVTHLSVRIITSFFLSRAVFLHLHAPHCFSPSSLPPTYKSCLFIAVSCPHKRKSSRPSFSSCKLLIQMAVARGPWSQRTRTARGKCGAVIKEKKMSPRANGTPGMVTTTTTWGYYLLVTFYKLFF